MNSAAFWLYNHILWTFFADFSIWQKYIAALDPKLLSLSDSVRAPNIGLEYDDLFKGTDSDIYIPLWASACVGNGDVLLDQTTLSVIEFYYSWGYKPIAMDGNPPDFIGQQLRFLAYLSACERHDPGCKEYRHAREEFLRLYLLPTAEAVASGIRKHAVRELFIQVANMLTAVANGDLPVWEADRNALADEYLLKSDLAEVCLNGRGAPIELGERMVINTAGCNNCGGRCIIKATVQEGCILALGTDSRLPACARGKSYRELYLTGRRLRYPMVRARERGAGKFRRVSWDEAVCVVAEEWSRIREKHGPHSRYVNYAFGVSAVLNPTSICRRLLAIDGGYLEYTNTYSYACASAATPFVYGDIYSGNSLQDLPNTKLLILWGHNPVETVFGTRRGFYLAQLKKNGGRIVVIDPRRSDSAAAADEWIGIKPSTDGALADAIAYVIWSEGLHDKRFMDTYCLGFDEEHMPDGSPPGQSYEAYLFGGQDGVAKTPGWAETITGVPADTITRLARKYATAKPACLLPGYGVQRTGSGEQVTRSLAMLACLTGNVGIPGGGAAGMGTVREMTRPAFPVLQNPARASIPAFMWTKAIEHGTEMTARGDGLTGVEKLKSNIKMIFNLAGNTLVNQHSDINNTVRILRDTTKCEYIVCSDVFMTPSAKFADILLPAASFFEADNIVYPWGHGAYLIHANRVIEPLFGCRFEYDWIREIAHLLGHLERFEDGHAKAVGWLEDIYNHLRETHDELPDYAKFKREGVYIFKDAPPYIAYEAQINEKAPFPTPSGKIEIFSPSLFEMGIPDEIPAIPKYVPCPEGPEDTGKYPLQLIGWHTKRSTHSIHYSLSETLYAHRLWIHPQDAKPRCISDGDTVEVFNDRGRLRIKAAVTERIIPGVTAMPQGAWYAPDESGMDLGGSINVLTAFRPTPLAKGNPQHTNLVEIAPL